MHGFSFFPIPAVIGIKCPHKNGYVCIDTFQNIVEIFAVIGEVISFKYFLIFIMSVFISGQQKNPVSLFPELQDHAVHQAAGAAHQQNIHLYASLPAVYNLRSNSDFSGRI